MKSISEITQHAGGWGRIKGMSSSHDGQVRGELGAYLAPLQETFIGEGELDQDLGLPLTSSTPRLDDRQGRAFELANPADDSGSHVDDDGDGGVSVDANNDIDDGGDDDERSTTHSVALSASPLLSAADAPMAWGLRSLRRFRVSIPSVIISSDGDGSFAAFQVSVSAGMGEWVVSRRYREFKALHGALKHLYPGRDLPPLPGKRIFGSSVEPSFVEKRQMGLQSYLQEICSNADLWKARELADFLDERTSMLKVHTLYSDVLDANDRLETQCLELQQQLSSAALEMIKRDEALQQQQRIIGSLMEKVGAALVREPENDGQVAHAEGGSSPTGRPLFAPMKSGASTVPWVPSASAPGQNGGRSRGPLVPPLFDGLPMIDMSDLDNLILRVESGPPGESDDDEGEDLFVSKGLGSNIPMGAYSKEHPESAGAVSVGSGAAGGGYGEGGGLAIPVAQGGGFFRMDLQRGTSIVGDPDDPLFQHCCDDPLQRSLHDPLQRSLHDPLQRSLHDPLQRSLHDPLQRSLHDPLQRSLHDPLQRSGHGAHGSGAFHGRALVRSISGGSFMGMAGMGLPLDLDISISGGTSAVWDSSRGLMLSGEVASDGDKSSHVLPLELVPSNQRPLAIDRRVGDLLRLLRPAPAAERYRESVFDLVSNQVRQTLGAQCFPLGSFALRTYLPDEEMGVCAFLCRGQEQTWFIKVNEVLCKASSGGLREREEQGGGTDGGAAGAGGSGESVFVHKLSNVNFVNSGPLPRIKCAVDNQVAVDITANQLPDLICVSFYEEVDRMLGKDHLFKRAILLIKAWWLYESRTYTGTNMLACINEQALLAMVLAVINQHHATLHTPLQVLAMFFHVYTDFDWDNACVGATGPRPIMRPDDGEVPRSPPFELTSREAEGLLIPPSILDQYRARCVGPAGDSSLGSQGFTVRRLNVEHPLLPEVNLIADGVSQRRANRVRQLFFTSARNMLPLLISLKKEASRAQRGQQQPPTMHMHTTSVTMFDSFFTLSWSRFGQGWRPDMRTEFEHHDSDDYLQWLTSESDPLGVDVDELRENIRYCALLLQEEVTDSAIYTLSKQILVEKGSVPVGEIGKLLQEATANPSLSQILKDKYGGLKRFLESRPETFFISHDHPFNPHVYLKSTMSQMDMEQALQETQGGGASSGSKKGKKGGRRKSGKGSVDTSSDAQSALVRDRMPPGLHQQHQQPAFDGSAAYEAMPAPHHQGYRGSTTSSQRLK